MDQLRAGPALQVGRVNGGAAGSRRWQVFVDRDAELFADAERFAPEDIDHAVARVCAARGDATVLVDIGSRGHFLPTAGKPEQ